MKYEVLGSNPLATYFFPLFLKSTLRFLPDQWFFLLKTASSHRLVLFCYRAMYIRKYVYVQIIENSI